METHYTLQREFEGFRLPPSVALLAGTLGMTFLSVVKETCVYANTTDSVLFRLHLLAAHGYYPLLVINFALLAAFIYRLCQRRRSSVALSLTLLVFIINIGLVSANNVLNIIEGRPLHSLHRGIGR